MARRRARSGAGPVSVPDSIPVSARVAWTYLAVLLALVGAGLLVALANQLLAPLACPPVSGDVSGDLQVTCELGSAIWSGIVGFLLCLIPTLRLLKLDWWLWAAVFAGAGCLVAVDAATEWWWWVAAALVPAAAALLSADWNRGPRFRRWQLIGLLGLDLAAVGALAWWFLGS
jgi:hypothetical protein